MTRSASACVSLARVRLLDASHLGRDGAGAGALFNQTRGARGSAFLKAAALSEPAFALPQAQKLPRHGRARSRSRSFEPATPRGSTPNAPSIAAYRMMLQGLVQPVAGLQERHGVVEPSASAAPRLEGGMSS